MLPEGEVNKRYKQALLIGVLMLLGLPVIFLAIAVFISTKGLEPFPNQEANKFMFLMLALVAFAEPFMYLIVRKVQIGNYRKNADTKMSVGKFVLNHEITRFSFVNSIYMIGLIVFLVSRDMNYMLYFYIYGLIWAALYWPRYERIKSLMESLEVL